MDLKGGTFMYKNRILNLIIIGLIFCILGLGGNIIYKNYQYDCEKYNNEIIDFTIELIKGQHSIDEIDTLDANDDVKNSLREYYQNTFYSDDDLILVYEDIDSVISKRKDALNIYNSIKETNSFEYNNKVFENITIDEFLNYEISVLFDPNIWSKDERYYFADIQKLLNNSDINNNSEISLDFINKDGDLYITVNDYMNNDVFIYKGYKIKKESILLEKRIRNSIYETKNISFIDLVNVVDTDGGFIYIVEDNINNHYDIEVNMKFLRINEIINIG